MPALPSPAQKVVFQAAAILALSLLLTFVAWRSVSGQAERLAQARFSDIAGGASAGLAARMQDYVQILRGGVGLMLADGAVDRAAWRRYVRRLELDRHYPGIQGVGYAIRVDPPALRRHEADVRVEGFPDYAVSPPGPRPVHYPIVFLEPFEGRNLRAFGYDMFSEPVRRAAMERARDNGAAALSGKVTLVQEDGRDMQAGALLYLPHYAAGADLSTVEGRRHAIRGFVFSPFRMGDLVSGVAGPLLSKIEISVFDEAAAEPVALYGEAAPADAAFVHRREVDMFGRRWLVEVRSTPALEAEIGNSVPDVVLGAGVIISLLLMWLTYAMVSERLKRVALAQANRDLAAARRAAEAADLAKSRFLAAASHDIRQPVQALALLIGALSHQLRDHPARRVLHHLDTSLDALRMLLNGLLDVSRLDAGVVEPAVAPTALAPLVEALGAEYTARAGEQGLDLAMDIQGVRAPTDAALLERILRNLLENALRYTVAGGVTLSCRLSEGAAHLTVRDTGIGIPREHLTRIFDEYHQVGNPERDRSQGLGLGLAIVRRLASILGHRVEVDSVLGQGSAFTVVIDGAEPVPLHPVRPDQADGAAASAHQLRTRPESTWTKLERR